MPGNFKALEIYRIVEDQLIVSFGGVVGLNIPAIKDVMEIKKIADRDACLDKVLLISRKKLSEQARARKDKEEDA